MPSALVPLATTTLASSSATVTFSSISGAYRDLRLIFNGLTTPTSAGMGGLINGDTGNNYYVVAMNGNGSTTQSTSELYTNAQYTYFTQVESSRHTLVRIDWLDYSVTDKQKTWLVRNGEAGLGAEATAGRWASTSAITTLTFTPSGGDQWAAGSTFSLYGIVS